MVADPVNAVVAAPQLGVPRFQIARSGCSARPQALQGLRSRTPDRSDTLFPADRCLYTPWAWIVSQRRCSHRTKCEKPIVKVSKGTTRRAADDAAP